jgi:hypothetical protein
MFSMLSNLFLGRRRTGLPGFFDRSRHGGVANAINTHRRSSALGAVAAIAAPFVIRKLMARRAQQQQAVPAGV